MTDYTITQHYRRHIPVLDRNDKRWLAFRELCNRFGAPIGSGSWRVVFKDGDTVIKMEVTKCGANRRELTGRTSDDYVGTRRLAGRLPARYRAKCWKDGELTAACGMLIIRMEMVTDPPGNMLLPPWAEMVDNGQVGMTRDGRLVAFDYAD